MLHPFWCWSFDSINDLALAAFYLLTAEVNYGADFVLSVFITFSHQNIAAIVLYCSSAWVQFKRIIISYNAVTLTFPTWRISPSLVSLKIKFAGAVFIPISASYVVVDLSVTTTMYRLLFHCSGSFPYVRSFVLSSALDRSPVIRYFESRCNLGAGIF